MKKLLVICGPTATGKTNLAFFLAKRFDGELIAADARQVYAGLDILSGKDIPDGFTRQESSLVSEGKAIPYWGNGTRIWLMDFVPRGEAFNSYRYRQAAGVVLDDLWRRGKLPIVVGGTGLYIAAVTGDTEVQSVPPDPALRSALGGLAAGELQKILSESDPQRFASLNHSDRNNPRRLIRAIEIAGKTPGNSGSVRRDFDCLQIGLTAPMALIEENIRRRIEARLAAGVLREVEETPPVPEPAGASDTAIGYAVLRRVIANDVTLAEGKRLWFTEERQYARRQLTWFKKNPRIAWYDVSENPAEPVESRVAAWYTGDNDAKG